MASLFDRNSDTIGVHISNIYKEGELEKKATTEESSVVRKEGKPEALEDQDEVGWFTLDQLEEIFKQPGQGRYFLPLIKKVRKLLS